MKFNTKFQLQITSPNYSSINYVTTFLFYVLTKNKVLDCQIQQINFPLKTKKFTLLKSPHVFKTARTQLELRNFKKTVVICNFNTIDEIQIFKKTLKGLVKTLPVAIKLKVKFFNLTFV